MTGFECFSDDEVHDLAAGVVSRKLRESFRAEHTYRRLVRDAAGQAAHTGAGSSAQSDRCDVELPAPISQGDVVVAGIALTEGP